MEKCVLTLGLDFATITDYGYHVPMHCMKCIMCLLSIFLLLNTKVLHKI